MVVCRALRPRRNQHVITKEYRSMCYLQSIAKHCLLLWIVWKRKMRKFGSKGKEGPYNPQAKRSKWEICCTPRFRNIHGRSLTHFPMWFLTSSTTTPYFLSKSFGWIVQWSGHAETFASWKSRFGNKNNWWFQTNLFHSFCSITTSCLIISS